MCPGVGWAGEARVRAVGERLGRREMQFHGTNAVLEVPAKACSCGCPLPLRPSASQAGVNNTKLAGTQACQRGVAHYYCLPACMPLQYSRRRDLHFLCLPPRPCLMPLAELMLSLDLLRLRVCDRQIARRHACPASALQPDRDGDSLVVTGTTALHPSSQASRSQFAVIMTPLFYRLPYHASKSFHPRSRPPTQRHFTSISRTALRSAVRFAPPLLHCAYAGSLASQ